MAEQSYSNETGYVTASMDISGANSVTQIFPKPFRLMEIRVFCSVVTATADETMTVTRRPIAGQTTSALTIGTFLVVSTLAAGDEVRVSFATASNCDFNSGEEVRIICGNSTGTGTVYFGLVGYHYTSGPNPQASFTALTTKPVTGSVGGIKYAAFTAA